MNKPFWLTGAIVVCVAVALVNSVSALSITTSPITFPGIVLDGTDQVVSSSGTWQADGRGETLGWNVSIASTDFDNGSGHTIPVSNFEIKLQDVNIIWVSGDTNKPVSTQTNFTSLGGTPIKIASAAISQGDGVYDLTPDLRLTVPAETHVGNFIATVTISISSGP